MLLTAHSRQCTCGRAADGSDSRTQREHALAGEIREEEEEEEGESEQEVRRLSSIATGMERRVPGREASRDEARLRAASPLGAWWLAADVLSRPVNTGDCVQRGEEHEGEAKQHNHSNNRAKKKSDLALIKQIVPTETLYLVLCGLKFTLRTRAAFTLACPKSAARCKRIVLYLWLKSGFSLQRLSGSQG